MSYRNLSDSSRVWIYQSNRQLSDTEVKQIQAEGEGFVKKWAAHGAELNAAIAVFYNRFIVLFADESQVIASRCSIDTSINFIKSLENKYQIDLFDRLNIAYKVDDRIECLKMSDFQEALNSGRISENTIVFNNLVETKASFENAWEVAVKESWHAQLMA